MRANDWVDYFQANGLGSASDGQRLNADVLLSNGTWINGVASAAPLGKFIELQMNDNKRSSPHFEHVVRASKIVAVRWHWE